MKIDINYLPKVALCLLVPDEYVALIYRKGAFPYEKGEEVEIKIVDGPEVLHTVKAKVVWKEDYNPVTAVLLSDWSGEMSFEDWIERAKKLTRSEPSRDTHEIVLFGEIQSGEVPNEVFERIKKVLS